MQKLATQRQVTASVDEQLKLIRSLLISLVGRDPEGIYRPEFVDKILQASTENPTMTFRGGGNFLTQLKAI